jgi:hypothetical protein
MTVFFLVAAGWVFGLAAFTEDCGLTPIRRMREVLLLSRRMRMIPTGRMGDILPLQC